MQCHFFRFAAIIALWLVAGFAPNAPRALAQMKASSTRQTSQRAYPMIESAFELPGLSGDPFDYAANNVRAGIRRPDGTLISLPAFFDGGTTWRVRHTPDAPGRYALTSLSRGGQPLNVGASPRVWTVKGRTVAGFVRLDKSNPRRFVRGSAAYFPLGHNQAWHSNELPDVPELFDKMGASGENWSRVWMNHWDGKNLDWLPDGQKPGEFGTLSLDVARRWDSIVQAAQKNNIAFQLVLQHHGQVSSQVNPNWNDNPYNQKNGGFLASPVEFFSDARAKELTKRKLRYTLARWGYSPSIAAWELWNEVQFSDAAREGKWDLIAAWHREMADFLRAQDVYGHLLTTSSSESVPLSVGDTMDYGQAHAYPADVIGAMAAGRTGTPANKPFFVGEFGPPEVNDPNGLALHAGLWAGLLSGEAGAPGFWTWDDVEKNNLYFHFRAASDFVRASGLAGRADLKKTAVSIETPTRGDLGFGPGGDWGAARQNEFRVTGDKAPEGMALLPRFVQGRANRSLGPLPLLFHVSLVQSGTFSVQLSQVAKAGAHLQLSVDGQNGIERDFPATAADSAPSGDAARLQIEVPQGDHVVSLQNSGSDWAQISRFTLSNSASTLGALALSNPNFFCAWVYGRSGVMAAPGTRTAFNTGQLRLPVLRAGRYRATWWDTRAGRVLQSRELLQKAGVPLAALTTPPIERDVALFVEPKFN